VAVEAALHLLGRSACGVGALALVLLAGCLVSAQGDALLVQRLLVAATSSLSLGWGLRFACDPAPAALRAGTRLALLAAGTALVVLCASLPWLLELGGGLR